MTVVDWAHATQGNASADAAMTYLLFALKDQEVADLYLNTFCKKSDTAKQYVQRQHSFQKIMNWKKISL